jgi:hypothetical protein
MFDQGRCWFSLFLGTFPLLSSVAAQANFIGLITQVIRSVTAIYFSSKNRIHKLQQPALTPMFNKTSFPLTVLIEVSI